MTKKHLKSRINRIKPKKSVFKNLFFWIAVLIIVIAGLAVYFLVFYPGIQVRNIVISGNSKVSTSDLNNIVSDYSSTGLLNFGSIKIASRSIFLVNEALMSQNILNRFPDVEKVTIHKNFPQTLTLGVTERQPLGAYCPSTDPAQTGGGCFLIDQSGVIFDQVQNPPADSAVIQQATGEGVLSPGQQVMPQDIITAIYKIQKNLQDTLNINLKEAFLSTPVRLDITTGANWRIYFDLDPSDNIDSQIIKLDLLVNGGISQDSMSSLRYIDLRPRDRAIVCDNATCGGN